MQHYTIVVVFDIQCIKMETGQSRFLSSCFLSYYINPNFVYIIIYREREIYLCAPQSVQTKLREVSLINS